jgi:phenylacetic acid degradation operon negative regulatory protein
MIAPFPRLNEVLALVEELAIRPHVHFFSQASSELTAPEAIVARCWDLGTLNARYAAFIERLRTQYERLLARHERGEALPQEECFVLRFWATYEYSAFPREDPFLPPELLSKEWLGVLASDLLSRYRALLKPATDAFIRQTLPIYTPAPDGVPRRVQSAERGP